MNLARPWMTIELQWYSTQNLWASNMCIPRASKLVVQSLKLASSRQLLSVWIHNTHNGLTWLSFTMKQNSENIHVPNSHFLTNKTSWISVLMHEVVTSSCSSFERTSSKQSHSLVNGRLERGSSLSKLMHRLYRKFKRVVHKFGNVSSLSLLENSVTIRIGAAAMGWLINYSISNKINWQTFCNGI